MSPDGMIDSSTPGEWQFVESKPFRDLRKQLLAGRNVLLSGAPGSGKTSALRILERELSRRGHVVCYVPGSQRRSSSTMEEEIASRLVKAAINVLSPAQLKEAHVLQSEILLKRVSDPSHSLVAIFRELQKSLPENRRIYLFLDDLNEYRAPFRVLKSIELLIGRAPDRLTVVLTGRPQALRHLLPRASIGREFVKINLTLTATDVERHLEHLIGLSRSDLEQRTSQEELRVVVEVVQRSPFLARAFAHALSKLGAGGSTEGLLDLVLDQFSEAEQKVMLQIALSGPEGLSTDYFAHLDDFANLVEMLVEKGIASWTDGPDGVALAHQGLLDAVLRRADVEIRLVDLDFGAEEAENDGALEASFVPHPGFAALSAGTKSIIVGDRGSGKSALVRVLTGSVQASRDTDAAIARGSPHRRPVEIKNPAAFFEAVTATGAGTSSAERSKATWLALVATKVAAYLLENFRHQMPTRLQSDCHIILRHFGYKDLADKHLSRVRRGLALLARLVKSHVRIKVGPVVIDPTGANQSKGGRELDALGFLTNASDWLESDADPLVVIADHVDEIQKYDRPAQEAIVQGLFLAESVLVPLAAIQFIIMIRTDLYQIYDLQEKNKIVSRTAHLKWPDDEVLMLLANRLLGNRALAELAERLDIHPGRRAEDLARFLRLCFPPEVEGERFRTWLLDSLRNGHERIAPRSIVLFLNAARDQAIRLDDDRGLFPLFPLVAVSNAMIQLSRLSYDEVVSDFRVSVNFVRNCRAHRLEQFKIEDVDELFSEEDGPVNQQVENLERLGFLRRTAERDDHGKLSTSFKIPRLYSRSWTTFESAVA